MRLAAAGSPGQMMLVAHSDAGGMLDLSWMCISNRSGTLLPSSVKFRLHGAWITLFLVISPMLLQLTVYIARCVHVGVECVQM